VTLAGGEGVTAVGGREGLGASAETGGVEGAGVLGAGVVEAGCVLVLVMVAGFVSVLTSILFLGALGS
jgi:hypothetical protein